MKFKTLEHNGPIFPDEYEVQGYILDNEKLSPLAEEMVYHYSAKLETEYVKSETFRKNFYKCLKPNLTPNQKKLDFPKDFEPLMKKIFKDIQKNKEIKAQYRKDHKEDIEIEKEKKKEKYGYAVLDGERQPLGAYLIEGPGIFIARGNSPLLGLWKRRITPEDVVINFVSKDKLPPEAPKGHHWKEIIADRNAFHTVTYKVDIGGVTEKIKEIRFGNNSDVKAEADMKKFDKAANLLLHMEEMTKYIKDNLTNSDRKTAECALVSWLLQTTGIRIGNERDSSIQADDIVGASTLKKENIWVEEKTLYLHFIGKDSIVFKNEYEVPTYIISALKKCLKGKKADEQVFTVSSQDVNDFLGACVEGCTPKLWRTAIATDLMVNALKDQKIKKSMSVPEKMRKFDLASLEVAKKLNHKKAVSKNFDSQIEKLDTRIQDSITKLTETEAKVKEELKKIDKQIEKANDIWEGNRLKEVLKGYKDKKKKLSEKLSKSKMKIEELKGKKDFKEQTADIAIGTSRTNYISPKIAYSISKDLEIPIEKIFTKALQEKFKWAENTDKDYWKKYPNV